jgi:Domain of unknown function (DUF4386)
MEEKLNSPKKTARMAGWIYLLMAITGGFSMMYVPSALFVRGDTSQTITNIMSNEVLFRLGIASALICQVAFVFLVLELHTLLKRFGKKLSVLMVALVIASVPIACLNTLNHFAVLALLNGDYVSALTTEQVNAWAMLFLDFSGYGIVIAELFWGLWLLPFGLLVIRSVFIPKILGVFLIIGCFCYLMEFFMHTLLPDYAKNVSVIIAVPMAISELAIVFWLLIKGVREPKRLAV